MTTIRDIFGRGYTSDRIGLELELESSKQQPLGWVSNQNMWTVHNDGSLRQNGVEYVFASPLWGGDIDAALQLFEDNTKNVPFVSTGYGSTHVHYNVGNLYVTEVMSIITGWAILEDAFLTVCEPSRDGNNFAQRFNVLNNLVATLVSGYGPNKRIDRLFSSVSADFWKYSNLNLATIRGIGTLEFRPYHSTWNIKEIRAWIDRIITFCKGMVSIGTPIQVLEAADGNLEEFINKYAGVPATEQLIDLTRRNISTAFRLAYVVDEWEDVKNLRTSKRGKKKESMSLEGDGSISGMQASVADIGEWRPTVDWTRTTIATAAEIMGRTGRAQAQRAFGEQFQREREEPVNRRFEEQIASLAGEESGDGNA